MRIHIEKLSTLLLKSRIQNGLSQTYIAQRVGISQKSYSRLEGGHGKIDIKRFLEIADCTHTHPLDIIDKIIEGKPSWGEGNSREKILFQEIEHLKNELETIKSENKYYKKLMDKLFGQNPPSMT